jgi:hypothetical protein
MLKKARDQNFQLNIFCRGDIFGRPGIDPRRGQTFFQKYLQKIGIFFENSLFQFFIGLMKSEPEVGREDFFSIRLQ